jgi:glycosyltransferase involved in cell wall biosynthesis
MRLLFIIQDRENYTAGPVINMVRLLPELVRRGYEVFALIVFRRARSSCAALLEKEGVNCTIVPFPKFTEDYIKDIFQHAQAIDPDVFIANVSFQGAYAGRWIKEAGVPVVVAHRSDDAHNWCMVDAFVLGKKEWLASGLLCVSSFLKGEVEKKLRHSLPVDVIPSGAPFSDHIAAHEAGTLKVIYAGRIEQKQKRIHDLVEAFIRIMDQKADVELTIIGEGSEKDALADVVARAGFSSRIIFKGMETGETYHKELSQHHVIILLSDYEGMPGSIIDGMMCGLVPVCLKINGIEDLVRHQETGLVVSDRAGDLRNALEVLREDVSFRRKLGVAALQHAKENFSVTVMADKWEALIAKLPKRKKTGREISLPPNLRLPGSTIPFEGAARRNPSFVYLLSEKFKAYKKKVVHYKALLFT